MHCIRTEFSKVSYYMHYENNLSLERIHVFHDFEVRIETVHLTY